MYRRQTSLDPAGGAFLSAVYWLVQFPLTVVLALVLLLFGRASLALFLIGKGRILRFVAWMVDADPGMYQRPRWRQTRIPIYMRNKRANGGTFRCEATGMQSDDLGLFAVDHRLSRSRWPLLAYDQKNLRLVCKDYNRRKSDKLYVSSFIWLFLTGWNAQSATVATIFVSISVAWRLGAWQ